MKKIIGFCGKAHSGKSHAANIIKSEYPNAEIISFGDAVRDMLKAIVDVDSIYESETKEEIIPELGVSLRKLMQTLGTEWGRNSVSDSLWVDIFMMKVNNSKSDIIIVPDVRFQNEYNAIINNGGIIINLKTGNDFKDIDLSSHVSESFIPENNDKTFNVINTFDKRFAGFLKVVYKPYLKDLQD